MDRIKKALRGPADADRPPAASDEPDLATPDGPAGAWPGASGYPIKWRGAEMGPTADAPVEVPAPNIFAGEGMAPPMEPLAADSGSPAIGSLRSQDSGRTGAEAEADNPAPTSSVDESDPGATAAQEPAWGWYDEFIVNGKNSSGADDAPDGSGGDVRLAAGGPTPEYPNLTFYIPPADDQASDAMMEPYLEPPAGHRMIEEEVSPVALAGDEGGVAGGIDPTSIVLKSGASIESEYNFYEPWPVKWQGSDAAPPDRPEEAAARDGGAEPAGQGGTDEPADKAPEADKLEAYDYPGDYAQPFDGVDKSTAGDGQPDLIAGTGAPDAAAGGQGGGIFSSGTLTVDDSTLGPSSDTVPKDATLAVDGTTTESGTSGPGVYRSQDSGRTWADDDTDDDDEPVALADLRSEGSRPLSDTAPAPEEVIDVPDAGEPADLDDADA